MAVLNLGGVANITGGTAGQCHCLRHRAATRRSTIHQGERDLATWTATEPWPGSGTVDEARLAKLLEHPYLTKP